MFDNFRHYLQLQLWPILFLKTRKQCYRLYFSAMNTKNMYSQYDKYEENVCFSQKYNFILELKCVSTTTKLNKVFVLCSHVFTFCAKYIFLLKSTAIYKCALVFLVTWNAKYLNQVDIIGST